MISCDRFPSCVRIWHETDAELLQEELDLIGKRVVLANGCFDLLHPGHLLVLEKARAVAGHLGIVIAAVPDDEAVSLLKGDGRPIVPVKDRARMLSSLRQVDVVVTYSEKGPPVGLIQRLRPNFVVKGGDYDPEKIVEARFVPVVCSGYDSQWSTTNYEKKIKGIP
jgi:rfaE bifunctional protein nucleotidyltransferase chain/domain